MVRVIQVSVSYPGGVPKLATAEAWVGPLGLDGDGHKARPDIHGGPDRAVCIYSVEAIARVRADGHQAFPGAFGENLTLQGVEMDALVPGDRLRIGGAGLLLELTDPTAPCHNNARWFTDGRIARISPQLYPADSRWYARVLAEGVVRPGDLVSIEKPVRPGSAAGQGHEATWSPETAQDSVARGA